MKEHDGMLRTSGEELMTTVCCAAGAPPAWTQTLVSRVHPDVLARPPAADAAHEIERGAR